MALGDGGAGEAATMVTSWIGGLGMAVGGCMLGGCCIAGARRMQRIFAAQRQLDSMILSAVGSGQGDARVVITGATSGIGEELARRFARHPSASLLLGCRDVDRAKRIFAPILSQGSSQLRIFKLELLDPDSVQSFADEAHKFLMEGSDGLRLLVNNAGVMRPPASMRPSGASSADMTWQINFLAPFLFVELLAHHRKVVKPPVPVRVVHVSSRLERRSKLDDELLQAVAAGKPGETQYSDSKRAGMLWISVRAQNLAFKSNLFVHASTPGMVDTQLGRYSVKPWLWPLTKPLRWMLLKSPAEGALSAVAGALRPQALSNFGRYFDGEVELEDLVMERMGEKRFALDVVKWATTITALDARSAGYDR